MSPSLPPSLLAKLSPKCVRCPRDRSADSDYCSECEDRQRGYVRKSKAGRRQERRAAHQCIDCGNQLPKRWDGSRCKQCRQVQATARRVKRRRRHVKQERRDLPAKRGHFKSELAYDSTSRSTKRYVGQAHRGGPTKVEQRAARLKLLVDAQRLFDRFREAVASGHPELDALPRIQRVEERARLAVDGTRAARLLLEAAAEEGCSVAPLWMRALAGEDDEA